MPSHHWFHYADVPVDHAEKYADGKVGRSKWDIVHMMAYCVDVLQGRIPEDNERKITKPIAVILLAHYVGDIHQPLHVGAEYFNETGKEVDPDQDKSALADEGGNTVELHLTGDPLSGRLPHTKKLHGFWDLDAVNALLPPVPENMRKEERYALIDPAKAKLVHDLATEEPKEWRLPAGVEARNAGEVWADEILPVAREAHERLTFQKHARSPSGRPGRRHGRRRGKAGHERARLQGVGRPGGPRRIAQGGLAPGRSFDTGSHTRTCGGDHASTRSGEIERPSQGLPPQGHKPINSRFSLPYWPPCTALSARGIAPPKEWLWPAA